MKLCIICKNEVKNSLQVCSTNCRFESCYEKDTQTGCFVWKGRISKQGTPIFQICRQKVPVAAKYSYLQKHTFNQNLYQNKYIMLSSCKNSLCVNPDHVFPSQRKIKDFSYSKEDEKKIIKLYLDSRFNTANKISEELQISPHAISSFLRKHKKEQLIEKNIISAPRLDAGICKNCKQKITSENEKRVKGFTYKYQCRPCFNQEYKSKYQKITIPLKRNCAYCGKEIETNKKLGHLKHCCYICKFHCSYTKQKNGCWIWNFISRNTISSLDYKEKSYSPKQISYSIKNKSNLSINTIVKNTCDNNLCVNPEHLTTERRKDLLVRVTKTFYKSTRKSKYSKELIDEMFYKINFLKWNKSETALHYNIDRGYMLKLFIKHGLILTNNLANKPCINCQKNHENTESEYCSPECMQEFLLK